MRDDKNRKLEENAHDIRLTDLIDSAIATESWNVYELSNARDPRILVLTGLTSHPHLLVALNHARSCSHPVRPIILSPLGV